MAKGLTMVASRPARDTDTISFPVLTYTDALPRSDLRDLDSGPSSQWPDHQTVGHWHFHRPRTSDGPPTRKPPPVPGARFDFHLTTLPEESMSSSTRSGLGGPTEQNTIGIALGSPSMSNSGRSLPPGSFDLSGVRTETVDRSSPTRKPSKWKKIGGLFRAKSALSQTLNQSQADNAKKSRNNHKPAEKSREAGRRKDSTEEWPSLELEANSQRQNHLYSEFIREDSQCGDNASNVGSSDSWPLLQVDIPNVQMERYSVMFGDVVNRNQQPSLLARRSKTLDRLQVPDADKFLKTKTVPVPQRRATSPARTSFTLFPNSYPVKAAQILGTQQVSQGPNSQLKTQTVSVGSPVETSTEQQPRVVTNSQHISSSDSLSVPATFSTQSLSPLSSSKSRNSDKHLPALRYEPPGTQSQTHPTHGNDDLRLPSNEFNHHKSLHLQPESEQEPITLVTIKSPSIASTTVTSFGSSKEKTEDTISPTPQSSDPKPRYSPVESTRVPLVDTPEPLDSGEFSPTAPTLEISIARSVSMSRGKRQMLVPIAARVDHLNTYERFVDRKTLTPRITDVQYGHGHRKAVSQQLQIESV